MSDRHYRLLQLPLDYRQGAAMLKGGLILAWLNLSVKYLRRVVEEGAQGEDERGLSVDFDAIMAIALEGGKLAYVA